MSGDRLPLSLLVSCGIVMVLDKKIYNGQCCTLAIVSLPNAVRELLLARFSHSPVLDVFCAKIRISTSQIYHVTIRTNPAVRVIYCSISRSDVLLPRGDSQGHDFVLAEIDVSLRFYFAT